MTLQLAESDLAFPQPLVCAFHILQRVQAVLKFG